jgi:hypothetical protein
MDLTFMNAQCHPQLIQNLEILPTNIEVSGNCCVGTRKYKKDVIICLTHQHGLSGKDGKGYADIIIDTKQAKQLVIDLNRAIEDNEG